MAYTVNSEGTVTPRKVSDGLRRAEAWLDGMKAFAATAADFLDPVEEAKDAYVSGEITIEAFEQRLNVVFHLS